jgi:hypothetical protein
MVIVEFSSIRRNREEGEKEVQRIVTGRVSTTTDPGDASTGSLASGKAGVQIEEDGQRKAIPCPLAVAG